MRSTPTTESIKERLDKAVAAIFVCEHMAELRPAAQEYQSAVEEATAFHGQQAPKELIDPLFKFCAQIKHHLVAQVVLVV